MKNTLQRPALWLIIFIVVLPQLSETIYTPSLPDIAHSMAVAESLVEYTLTIYLAGFAVGVLLWGILSDRIGRRPALLSGLFIYLLGTLGCWLSDNITALMIARFVQAFGGSTGSVLGQAIARDAFPGNERGKVFSTIMLAISAAPALGPIIGGFTDEYFGWSAVFLVLLALGTFVTLCVFIKLAETNAALGNKDIKPNLIKNCKILFRDPHVMMFGLLVGACNGIIFSLFSEGPFYMINMLGLTPGQYGLMYIFIAFAMAVGAWISRHLHTKHYGSNNIIIKGCVVTFMASIIWVGLAYGGLIAIHYSVLSPVLVIGCMMFVLLGIGMIIPNCLSQALENYKEMAGSAASIFGFYYYTLVSLATFGIGLIHNGTIYPMPLYFCALSGVMMSLFYLKTKSDSHKIAIKI